MKKFPVTASFEDAGMRDGSRIFMLSKAFGYESRRAMRPQPRYPHRPRSLLCTHVVAGIMLIILLLATK